MPPQSSTTWTKPPSSIKRHHLESKAQSLQLKTCTQRQQTKTTTVTMQTSWMLASTLPCQISTVIKPGRCRPGRAASAEVRTSSTRPTTTTTMSSRRRRTRSRSPASSPCLSKNGNSKTDKSSKKPPRQTQMMVDSSYLQTMTLMMTMTDWDVVTNAYTPLS